ncbi:hypothetical protein ACIJYE_00855 [Candidatus Pelagibacter bacterium nBUS_30]|uniref:hypothetical protein n=1 Tax=Candidatus Pelagibacter bacterium nBUS_30 TaxID=3374191 RepID=UPI003EB760DC
MNRINFFSILSSIVIFIFIPTIFVSNFYFSEITYFYTDNLLINFIHNLSKDKKILDIIVNIFSINGIAITPHNPSLNFLSELNYNLNSQKDYLIYLSFLRTLEFLSILIFAIYFLNKKKILNFLVFAILLYLLFLNTFTIFDHQSYINLPIIIFNISLGLSLFFKKRFILFSTILILGNLFSYLINPMYFFVTCFGPFLYFLLFLIFEKNYKQMLIAIIINIPFSLMFVLLSIGTARFSLGNYLLPVEDHYNFAIFNSQSLQIAFLTLIITNLIYFFKKRVFPYQKIAFIIYGFLFLSLFLGLIYKFKIIKWLLPSPIYIDYSLQYIYVFSIALIFSSFDNFKKLYFSIILFFLVIIKSVNYYKIFLSNDNLIYEKKYYSYHSIQKRNFWEKNSNHFLKTKYENKKLLIDFPNTKTDYSKHILKNNKFDDFMSYQVFNTKFNHSMNEFEYHSNSIITNLGHSLLLDISTFKANQTKENILYRKERIPGLQVDSKLINLYKIDYIFSDKKHDLSIDEIFNFNEFNLYVYKSNKDQINEFLEVKKIINFENYLEDIKNFDKYLYVLNNKFENKNIKICTISRKIIGKELTFKINTNEKCIAIFPIPFSFTNDFKIINQKINSNCKTFRAQYYFHGCVFNNDTQIILKKKNLILYPFYFFKDFYVSKKLKII